MLDENISWEEHFRTVETKLANDIRLLYRAKPLLEEKPLRSIYFVYIYSYLNEANIAWASTYKTKLTSFIKSMLYVCIVFNEEKLTHSRPLLRSLNVLNVNQINLYQYIAFMCKLNKNKVPLTFNEVFENPFHKYSTQFSENCVSLKAISLKSSNILFLSIMQKFGINS